VRIILFNLKVLEGELDVNIVSRGETISIAGSPNNLEKADEILQGLLTIIRKGIKIGPREVVYAIQLAKKGTLEYFADLYEEEIARSAKGKSIRVKTLGQKEYISAIRHNDLVFGIGPAGTGKTYFSSCRLINFD